MGDGKGAYFSANTRAGGFLLLIDTDGDALGHMEEKMDEDTPVHTTRCTDKPEIPMLIFHAL